MHNLNTEHINNFDAFGWYGVAGEHVAPPGNAHLGHRNRRWSDSRSMDSRHCKADKLLLIVKRSNHIKYHIPIDSEIPIVGHALQPVLQQCEGVRLRQQHQNAEQRLWQVLGVGAIILRRYERQAQCCKNNGGDLMKPKSTRVTN